VHERLDRLERANRRLRSAVVATALAALLPWVVAARGASDVVESTEIVLRDAAGVHRGGLRVTAGGEAALTLADGSGHERFVATTDAAGRSGLGFYDAEGHPRARFQTTDDSSLNFYDRRGKLRAAFGLTEYGPRWVSEAVDRAVRAAAASGDPFAIDVREIERAVERGNAETQQGPVLKLFDPRGRPRLEARVDMDRPVIFLQTDDGGLRIVRTQAVREGE
jgi:hypothetical protein